MFERFSQGIAVAGVMVSAYLLMSAVTFLVYALDKRAARRGAWRVRESTLHSLALLGGWPGAIAAQQLLRHKTRARPFRRLFWATVVLNCAAAALALSVSAW